MLTITFIITALCTLLVILTARRHQVKAAKKTEASITPEEPSSSNVKMKHARPSPVASGSPRATPFSLNDNDQEDLQGSQNSTAKGVIFVDSEYAQGDRGGQRQSEITTAANETTPLLKSGKIEAEPSSDFQFGVISEDTGLWYRDLSGKHLIRFVILLLLLLFSSLVVSLLLL